MVMGIKNWTIEEVNSLEESWGKYSLSTISKRLGRTEQAIKQKAFKLGLGNPVDNYGGFTLHALSKYLKVDYKRIINWVERYDFPVKTKKFTSEKRIQVVKEKDFWKWLEANKQMVDFSKIEPNSFGNEPDWFRAKRDADYIKARKVKKSNESAWTKEEDNILKGMLSAFIYTYTDISNRLNRSQGAIKTRIRKLELQARPVRSDNLYPDDVILSAYERPHWTEEEIQRLIELGSNHKYNIVELSFVLGRTVTSVRDKIRVDQLEVQLKEYKAPRGTNGRFTKDPLQAQLPVKEIRKSWTKEEDHTIKQMCEEQHTIVDISTQLNRTLGSVKNRLRKLGVTARTIDEYTPNQVALIEAMIMKGHCLEDIGERIGRSALGVRGKLERMGYKFKNGVPIPPNKEFSHLDFLIKKR
jgi:hypothetical protein